MLLLQSSLFIYNFTFMNVFPFFISLSLSPFLSPLKWCVFKSIPTWLFPAPMMSGCLLFPVLQYQKYFSFSRFSLPLSRVPPSWKLCRFSVSRSLSLSVSLSLCLSLCVCLSLSISQLKRWYKIFGQGTASEHDLYPESTAMRPLSSIAWPSTVRKMRRW